ncbi:hypothetical protein [uncultured Roseovarius sp.]|uniref:DUF2946 family protein n=1 Tax=uncultured Roseovarius sp. TaxID=293344 RepID=UPI00261143DA|nr:hypothetical protein [uncultured Roseovarius sp.]
MRVSLSPFPRLILVFALSVAMAAVGFAHRGNDERSMDPDYLAFVAAGGTAQDLCEDHVAQDGPSGHSKHQATNGCEACRLVDGVLMPSAEMPCTAWLAPRIVDLRPDGSHGLRLARSNVLPQSRAPPRV